MLLNYRNFCRTFIQSEIGLEAKYELWGGEMRDEIIPFFRLPYYHCKI